MTTLLSERRLNVVVFLAGFTTRKFSCCVRSGVPDIMRQSMFSSHVRYQ